MKTHALGFGVAAAALIALGACSEKSAGGNGTEQPKAQTPKAAKAAGTKTIAAGLPADSRFMASAKAAPNVCGVRLYVEQENLTAQTVYQRLGLSPSGYKVYEQDFVLGPHDRLTST